MEIGKGKEKDSITTSITSLPPYLPPTSSFTPPLTPRTPLRRFRRRCHNGLHPCSPRSQGDAGFIQFGQNASFGGFGATPSGSTLQQSYPTFGSSTFGSTTPFGATSQLAFGSISTSAFGAMSIQAFSAMTTSAFGASASPVFGATTTPAFGASTSPIFGATTTTSPIFGPMTTLAFGASPTFGATTTPTFGASTSPIFGATTALAFGASTSLIFGATTTPAFGASTFPILGATNTPAFGASTSPIFGATASPICGVTTTQAFRATTTPAFGVSTSPISETMTTRAFGVSTSPMFGATTTPAFGANTFPTFGSTTSLFGSTGTTFGAPSTSTFGSIGAQSTSIFRCSASPAFGVNNTPSFGSSAPFGAPAPSFGQSQFTSGAQMEKDTFSSTRFRQAFFGGQQAGSRVVKHTKTPTTEEYNPFGGNLQSLSAMPVYKDKSHEELRWEDYQHGDRGGPSSAGQAAMGVGFPMSRQASPFSPAGTFGQSSASVFGSPFATSFPVDHEDMQLAMAIESSIQSAIAEGVSFNLNTRDSRSEPKTEDSEGCSSNSTTSGSCRICLDARVEGALIPCGHMAGCMSCLNEIKRRNLGCPVCRAKICQVVRIYVV